MSSKRLLNQYNYVPSLSISISILILHLSHKILKLSMVYLIYISQFVDVISILKVLVHAQITRKHLRLKFVNT